MRTSDCDLSEYFGDNVHEHFVSEATDTFMYNAGFQFACLKYIPKLVKTESIGIIHFGHYMSGQLLEFRGLNIARAEKDSFVLISGDFTS